MKHAINLQKLREKKSSKVQAKILKEQKLREKQDRDAMVKSFRSLTILLGKLGIAKGKFYHDHDRDDMFLTTLGLPRSRPPWPTGKTYGLTVGESYQWVMRYIGRKSRT